MFYHQLTSKTSFLKAIYLKRFLSGALVLALLVVGDGARAADSSFLDIFSQEIGAPTDTEVAPQVSAATCSSEWVSENFNRSNHHDPETSYP